MYTLKVKCSECRGEGALEYDVDGYAVQRRCDLCDAKGSHYPKVVPFCDFAAAFGNIAAVPVYNEEYVAGDSFQPFELHMRWSTMWHGEINSILNTADSLGLHAHLLSRGNDGLAFYFTNK